MKLTKEALKRIIKEELEATLRESFQQEFPQEQEVLQIALELNNSDLGTVDLRSYSEHKDEPHMRDQIRKMNKVAQERGFTPIATGDNYNGDTIDLYLSGREIIIMGPQGEITASDARDAAMKLSQM
jgi:hypothetical protein